MPNRRSPARGGPAHGSRPPFPVGHKTGLQHAAYDLDAVEPIAREMVQAIMSDPTVTYLREPRYRAELAAWSAAEARCLLLRGWLAERGLLDDTGDVRAAARYLDTCEARAARCRAALGLSPRSAAELGRDVVAAEAGLAQLAEQGRQAREAAETRLRVVGQGPEIDGERFSDGPAGDRPGPA
jgi:hypothetical protein